MADEQSNDGKTHFRKAFHSPYLGAVDIVEPIVLTVDHVALEPDRTKQSKEFFNTCYWREKFIRKGEAMKPMILNATNSKFMAFYTGSKFIEDWGGATVEVWVDPDVRFGRDTVEGLRLRAAQARQEPPRDLIATGEAKVAAGAVEFAKWWNTLDTPTRSLIGKAQRDAWLAEAKTVAPAPAATTNQEGPI